MQTSSKVMYTVGKVINIIEIVCAALILVLGIFSIIFAPEIAAEGAKQAVTKFDSVSEVKAAGVAIVVAGAISVVISSLVLHFANKAKKALDTDPKNTNSHVIMLVIGIFGDIFYFLGGLFGLLAGNQTSEKQQ